MRLKFLERRPDERYKDWEDRILTYILGAGCVVALVVFALSLSWLFDKQRDINDKNLRGASHHHAVAVVQAEDIRDAY